MNFGTFTIIFWFPIRIQLSLTSKSFTLGTSKNVTNPKRLSFLSYLVETTTSFTFPYLWKPDYSSFFPKSSGKFVKKKEQLNVLTNLAPQQRSLPLVMKGLLISTPLKPFTFPISFKTPDSLLSLSSQFFISSSWFLIS